MTHLVSSANRKGEEEVIESGRSLTKRVNNRGPRMLPCGTPEVTGSCDEKVPLIV